MFISSHATTIYSLQNIIMSCIIICCALKGQFMNNHQGSCDLLHTHGPKVLTSLLYGHVQGHLTLEFFHELTL